MSTNFLETFIEKYTESLKSSTIFFFFFYNFSLSSSFFLVSGFPTGYSGINIILVQYFFSLVHLMEIF